MRAAVAIAVAVALAGCGGSRPTAGPAPEPSAADVPLEPQQPADADEAENSGRSLSGVYVLATPSPPETAATWTFAADGTYSRSRTFGRAERRDAGTYVVDTAGRLVLFVEQQGDSRLAWAERVTFALGGDPATAVVVTTSEGRAETLVRTGDAPPTR
jgi:hypothetical protein